MPEIQHVRANKFGLSDLAKCRREMLFFLGVEAVTICIKDVEQHICFPEQLIQDYVRLY